MTSIGDVVRASLTAEGLTQVSAGSGKIKGTEIFVRCKEIRMLRAKEPFHQFLDDPTLSKAWKTCKKLDS
jgi:hypothetical protein